MDRTRRYRPICRLLALVASLGMLALMAPTVGLSAALGPQASSRLASTVDGAAALAGEGAARASLFGDPVIARITDAGSVEAILAQATPPTWRWSRAGRPRQPLAPLSLTRS